MADPSVSTLNRLSPRDTVMATIAATTTTSTTASACAATATTAAAAIPPEQMLTTAQVCERLRLNVHNLGTFVDEEQCKFGSTTLVNASFHKEGTKP